MEPILNSIEVPKHNDKSIDNLLAGRKWKDAENLTYNFPKDNSKLVAKHDASWVNDISAMEENLRDDIKETLQEIESFTKLKFSEVGPDDEAILSFLNTKEIFPGFEVIGFNLRGSVGHNIGGTVVIDEENLPNLEATHQDQLIHNGIAVALGLRNRQQLDGDMQQNPNNQLRSISDTVVQTANSPEAMQLYPEIINRYDRTIPAPDTFMVYDMAALQYMYGANYDFRAEDTIYKWQATEGEEQTLTDSKVFYRTIWDGNGFDSYDFTAMENDLKLDLRPGETTLFSIGDKQFCILRNSLLHNDDNRSLIEGGFGGSGDDIIHGNNAINVLSGNAGNDFIRGYAGIDIISGGAGNDYIRGDEDTDIITTGSGSDKIVATINMGNDIIIDFDPSNDGDIIQIDNRFDLDNVETIINEATSNGISTTLKLGENSLITLMGVTKEQLSEQNFEFANLRV